MAEVIPLKYGSVFKRAFSNPNVFRQFVADILGIEIEVEQVHTEYEYPEPVGFVRSTYDLFAEDPKQRIIVEIQHVKEEDFFDRFFYYHLISLVEQVRGYKEYAFERTVYTLVVLTSVPQDRSVDFSVAVSDFSPVDERGQRVAVYPHRLIFLTPRLVNAETPPQIAKWLNFIADSLDGEMEETGYPDAVFREIMHSIRRQSLSREELAEIKDEAAWDKATARFMAEGREEGRVEGHAKGLAEGRAEGHAAGRAAGHTEGACAIVLRLLQRRFTELSATDAERIRALSNAKLEVLTDQHLAFTSLDELRAWLESMA